MSNLHGKVVVVAAGCEVAAALASRLAKQGVRIVLGAPPSDTLDEIVAELKWECASIERRELDPAEPGALERLAAYARRSFGPADAVVVVGAVASGAPDVGAARLIHVATEGETAVGDGPLLASTGLRVTTISAIPEARLAAHPAAIADAVAFALAGAGEVRSIVLRPAALAA